MRAGRRCRDRGFMLLALLIVVGVAAAAAMTLVSRWSDELRRDQELELLRVGDEIAGAIASYRRASAGSPIKHPPQLEDLLEDRRAFGTLRHLRQVYADPANRGAAWGLILASDGGVMGVHSQSNAPPMRQVAAKLRNVDLPPATSYTHWRFVPREDAR